MAFKDENCTCENYCACSDCEPCGCQNMLRDPHCAWCCQHLNPEQETKWRQEEGSQDAIIGPY